MATTQIPYHKLIDDSTLNVSMYSSNSDHHRQLPFNPQSMYSNRKKAIICINLFTILQFMFMMGSKYVMAANNVNGLDYCLMRTVVCLVIHSFSLFVIFRKDWRVPKKDFGWVMTRNIAGTFVIISLVYAMQYLPMGIYTLIYNTSPFWASLLAFMFLNE